MNNEKNNHHVFLGFILLILLVIILGSCSSFLGDEEKSKQSDGMKEEKVETQEPGWQKEIRKTVASDNTASEKADEISLLASTYKPSEQELQEFEEYIIEEFTKDKYLSDIKNHEYMLTNIFKCRVVENYYDDQEQRPIDKFAYDFFQNTNHTYRGAFTVESEEVKLNEEQMNKTLLEMK